MKTLKKSHLKSLIQGFYVIKTSEMALTKKKKDNSTNLSLGLKKKKKKLPKGTIVQSKLLNVYI